MASLTTVLSTPIAYLSFWVLICGDGAILVEPKKKAGKPPPPLILTVCVRLQILKTLHLPGNHRTLYIVHPFPVKGLPDFWTVLSGHRGGPVWAVGLSQVSVFWS